MAEQVSKRSIVYEITTDFGKSKMDAKEAVNQFEKFGNELEKDANKAKSLTAQLRAMRNELNKLDEGSAEFQKLAVEAAKLEDKIGDVRQRVRNLASDTKNLDAFVSIATGIAGGFAVAQGAVALFGKENKKLQETLLKVQASLAILNGLQQVQATIMNESAARTFVMVNAQKAYNFVVGTSTGLLKAFKLALAATGIGLAVIVITELVSRWDLFNESVDESNNKLDDFRTELEKTINKINEQDEFLGRKSFEQVRTQLENNRKAIIKNWHLTEEEKTKLLEENKKEREQLEEEFAKFVNDRAKKSAIAEKELRVLEAKEGTKERLEAEIALINYVRDEDLKKFGLTQNEKLLIIEKALIREKELRKKYVEVDPEKPIEVVAKTQEKINTISAFAYQQDVEAKRKAEEEKQGLIIKTAEVQGTAHAQVMAEMQAEIEMREKLFFVAQSSASIFNSLAQLAGDNARAQLGLSIASIIASNAEALAKGVASAAGTKFPANIPAIFSVVATITSVFAQIKSMGEQARAAMASAAPRPQGFAEGTPYLDRDGHPAGRDTIPIMANEGERIIPTSDNLRNWDILEAIRNNSLEDFIGINYVAPALAAKTLDEIEKDSMIDYSNRFYKQLLATAEGNSIHKKQLNLLSSIDTKLNRAIPPRYA